MAQDRRPDQRALGRLPGRSDPADGAGGRGGHRVRVEDRGDGFDAVDQAGTDPAQVCRLVHS
jgi:hypothetical protein